MAGFPYSSAVVNGTNAVGSDHNNARKDGLTRFFKFEILGSLVVGNTQGGSYILPFSGSVVQTYLKTDSGSATVRINTDTDGILDSGMSATSSTSVDSTLAHPAVTKNAVLTLDITAISSGVHLIAIVEILPTP